MKRNFKKAVLIVVILAMTVSLAGCTWFGNNNYISKQAAKDAALADAGLAAADVTKLTCNLEKEEGYAYYEVDFVYDAKEYEYAVDATTGEVKNVKSESVFD